MSLLPKQHALMEKVKPWSGQVSKGLQVDFLGIRTRTSFFSQLRPFDQEGFSSPPLPPFDEEYFEWVDLFESISKARKNFTMIELGAGYGRWLVRAAFAARWFGEIQCKLIGVEAEPKHFDWMRLHFEDNGLNPDEYSLIRGAVSKQDGTAWFLVGASGECYGQRIIRPQDFWTFAKQLFSRSVPGSENSAQQARSGFPFYRIKRVRTISLNTMLESLQEVDLIDLDVQGAELEVLASATEGLISKVRKVHIGAHGKAVESGLRSLFRGLAWQGVFDFRERVLALHLGVLSGSRTAFRAG